MKHSTANIAATIAYVSVAVALTFPLYGQTKSKPVETGLEEVTVLPRYTVLSEILAITFSRNMGGSLTGGEVTWVAKDSVAQKRGVQVFDELVSIDGLEIAGKNYTEIHNLLERELKPGESIRLLFSGRRGVFGRRLNYIFTIKRAGPIT
jgi:hypothetical protein